MLLSLGLSYMKIPLCYYTSNLLKTYNLCQGFPKNIFWYFLGWDFTISAQIFWKWFVRNIGQFEPLRQYQNDSNMARAFWRSRGLFYVCLHLFFGCSHMFFLHARYKWDDIGRNRNNVQIQKREKSKKLINKHKKWKKNPWYSFFFQRLSNIQKP